MNYLIKCGSLEFRMGEKCFCQDTDARSSVADRLR